MSAAVGVVIFVVSIFLVIVIHEAAHFGVAKAFKIKVEEFFIGFGPRLWSVKRGETEYGVKAIPAGGYVRIAGMNPFEEPTPEEYPRTFGAKPIWQRALVIFAGPASHFVIAFLIFVAYFWFLGLPKSFAPFVASVDRGSPAAAAGLRPGDDIIRVDGIVLPTSDQLVTFTRAHVGVPITIEIQRGSQVLTRTVTPVLGKVPGLKRKVGRIGVSLDLTHVLSRDHKGFFGAVASGAVALSNTVVLVIQRLGDVFGPRGLGRVYDLLFGNAHRNAGDVTSIVGVGRVAGQATAAGAWDLLFPLIASINIFVGILNLLPLPPFDGGHLAVLAVEKVRGRKVDMKKLIPLTAAVAAFLVLFMVSVLYLDIFKPIPNQFR